VRRHKATEISGLFCSVVCARAHSRKAVRQECKICGVNFMVSPAELKKGKNHGSLCSRKCKGIWHSQTLIREKSSRWNGGPARRECETCGLAFYIGHSVLERGGGRFCSRECYGTWTGKNKSGANSPNWRGGQAGYPATFNQAFKESIRERDNYHCAICRLAGLPVHHIDYDKMNTVPDNCITLCRKCHVATNYNRQYWQSALTELMRRREPLSLLRMTA
jgi:hypothetical protein